MSTKVAVLILAFNRPEHVVKALEPVRVYQPERLYLACDGPRARKKGEAVLVYATQKAMLKIIDWPCDVKTLFRKENLGCANAVYEAITWFFEHEEYGIIIEDDVIVGQDFFKLCEVLLSRYANEEKIMEISAENHSGRIDINNSYVYSQYFLCWGWATWRRAWAKMDMSMKAVKELSTFYFIKRLGLFRGMMMRYYFKKGYRHINNFNSWATRWYLSILALDGLVLCPGVNLAINIGMEGGTHYYSARDNLYSSLSIGKMDWPLVYNDKCAIDKKQKKYDSIDFFCIRMIGLKKKLFG